MSATFAVPHTGIVPPLLSPRLRRALRRKPLVSVSMAGLRTGDCLLRISKRVNDNMVTFHVSPGKYKPIKIILHRKIPVLVLAETECLRYIRTRGNDSGFWIPRRPADRKRLNNARRRTRRYRPLWTPPCWTGEARPAKDTVSLESISPSDLNFAELKKLCFELGYPRTALSSRLPGWRYQRPARSRRKKTVEKETLIPGVPNADGFTPEQVTKAIAKRRWDDAMSYSVFTVVYKEKPVRDIAAEHGLASSKQLSHYVWKVRKDLRNEKFAALEKRPNSFPVNIAVDKTAPDTSIQTSFEGERSNESKPS